MPSRRFQDGAGGHTEVSPAGWEALHGGRGSSGGLVCGAGALAEGASSAGGCGPGHCVVNVRRGSTLLARSEGHARRWELFVWGACHAALRGRFCLLLPGLAGEGSDHALRIYAGLGAGRPRSALAWLRWRCSYSSPAHLARTALPGNLWRSGSRSRALPARRTTTAARTARTRACVHPPRPLVLAWRCLLPASAKRQFTPLLTFPHLADWGGVGFHRHCGSG